MITGMRSWKAIEHAFGAFFKNENFAIDCK